MRSNARIITCALMAALLGLSACKYLPQEFGGPAKPKAKLKGERYDVIVGSDALAVNPDTEGRPVDLPSPAKNPVWTNRAAISSFPNLEVDGFEHHASASVGNGDEFEQSLAPSPIVTEKFVIAMDGSGTISAHDRRDISNVSWTNEEGVEGDETEILGGGLTIEGDTIYATTGYGNLLAIEHATGKTIWKAKVGAPVRGAPDSLDPYVIVLTADNQTIAFDNKTGTPIWNHRGIKENSGYFSMTSPVIAEGLVFVAYSSGELFALRLETGRPVWADTVSSVSRTSALSGFSGINADPMAQDGVVYTVGAAGGMIASAVLNGRPLWQQDIASIVTPWGAGNMMFALTVRHELAGMFKRDGEIAFRIDLAENDNLGRDITPKLFAPIVLNGDVCVLGETGLMRCYDPATAKKTRTVELEDEIAAPPVVAAGQIYLITTDGTLHQYGK